MMPERFNYVHKDATRRRRGGWIAQAAILLAIGLGALIWERVSHGETRPDGREPSGDVKPVGASGAPRPAG
jgi:hypothetical protein